MEYDKIVYVGFGMAWILVLYNMLIKGKPTIESFLIWTSILLFVVLLMLRIDIKQDKEKQ